MKNNTMVQAFCGMVLVTGMVLAGSSMAGAGEAALSDWDSFVKTIDPSSAAGSVKEPLCQRVTDPNTASAALISDWDSFMLSIDPGQAANVNKVMLCTDAANSEIAKTTESDWDAFLKMISPRT